MPEESAWQPEIQPEEQFLEQNPKNSKFAAIKDMKDIVTVKDLLLFIASTDGNTNDGKF
jgi:hypothetical protein